MRRLAARGCTFVVERGAGQASGYDDASYEEAGAALVDPSTEQWSQTDVVLAVQGSDLAQQRAELASLKPGALLLGLLEPHGNDALKQRFEAGRVTALAL